MKLNQITVPVRDMEKAVAFYQTLGLKLLVDTPHYARFLAPDGDTTFSLSLSEDDFTNGAVIYFESENLHEQCAALEAKGLEFRQQPAMQRYLWEEAILEDPSGNLIKIYHAGENRINPPWRVRD